MRLSSWHWKEARSKSRSWRPECVGLLFVPGWTCSLKRYQRISKDGLVIAGAGAGRGGWCWAEAQRWSREGCAQVRAEGEGADLPGKAEGLLELTHPSCRKTKCSPWEFLFILSHTVKKKTEKKLFLLMLGRFSLSPLSYCTAMVYKECYSHVEDI